MKYIPQHSTEIKNIIPETFKYNLFLKNTKPTKAPIEKVKTHIGNTDKNFSAYRLRIKNNMEFNNRIVPIIALESLLNKIALVSNNIAINPKKISNQKFSKI